MIGALELLETFVSFELFVTAYACGVPAAIKSTKKYAMSEKIARVERERGTERSLFGRPFSWTNPQALWGSGPSEDDGAWFKGIPVFSCAVLSSVFEGAWRLGAHSFFLISARMSLSSSRAFATAFAKNSFRVSPLRTARIFALVCTSSSRYMFTRAILRSVSSLFLLSLNAHPKGILRVVSGSLWSFVVVSVQMQNTDAPYNERIRPYVEK